MRIGIAELLAFAYNLEYLLRLTKLKYTIRCETVYFMMRRKLLHWMMEVCGATSRIMKDEFIVGEHQVDGTRLLIYIYT